MSFVQLWWDALVRPEEAGRLVWQSPRGFTRFLAVLTTVMYAAYGLSMGLFHSTLAGDVSAVKLPVLYLLSLAVCFSALHTLNALLGARLCVRACLRLLLAISTNAVALVGYAPFSLFFTLTTSHDGYTFLVAMHIVVFALAGLLSLVQIVRIFIAAARRSERRSNPALFFVWALLYMFVGTQLAWVLRPFVGSPAAPFSLFREREGNFYESVYEALRHPTAQPEPPAQGPGTDTP